MDGCSGLLYGLEIQRLDVDLWTCPWRRVVNLTVKGLSHCCDTRKLWTRPVNYILFQCARSPVQSCTVLVVQVVLINLLLFINLFFKTGTLRYRYSTGTEQLLVRNYYITCTVLCCTLCSTVLWLIQYCTVQYCSA
jgi:hypothetical protein